MCFRLLLFGLACALAAAPTRLADGSFELVKSGRVSDGWRAVAGSAAADEKIQRQGRSTMRLEAGRDAHAQVQSTPVTLTIGKRYELSVWARADQIHVRDLDRGPVAAGATISMASMPWDMRSNSIGGTREWTQLKLRFTATRERDHILLTAGLNGALSGRAWFDGVTLEEIGTTGAWPAGAAVKTFGPAYRYPSGGWIYLHIEGAPYERGYQHGYLMAREIPQYLGRCASDLDSRARERVWDWGRTTSNALFLRGFDREILEEMKGIAEGAAAAGAKFHNRAVDLLDIVAANTTVELSLLNSALPMTPSGLEGLKLERPRYFNPERDVPVTERCSAFAATGKATRDGRMVIGHITMWPLTLAEQTNVMLDIQPASGHRVLMQSYPGGIESGTDWYQNDAGVVLTETTIRQSPFNVRGTPVAFRARKAIQYGSNVDKVVEHLKTDNNGLYTNEWLIGDAKNNEVAMFELGTYKTRLWRSSKNDWFAGTEGFYWGCNNAKDLDVRLEYVPDPQGAPQHLPFVPAARDIKWQELYEKHKGQIDEQFGFLAFRTAPLVSSTSMDAKVANAEMASRMMAWGVFGKPNEREWVPSPYQKENHPSNAGIYSSGYRLIEAKPSESLRNIVRENEQARLAAKAAAKTSEKKTSYKDKLWKGWILPADDAAVWLSAGSAAYHQVLGSEDVEKRLESHRVEYRSVAARRDVALISIRSDPRSRDWFPLAQSKGVLLLDALRLEIGDEKFFALMRDFFAANTTKAVTTRQFRDAAGSGQDSFFRKWLEEPGLPGDVGGAVWLQAHLVSRLNSAIIVYGTTTEAGANRYAAEQLQKRFLDMYESVVPVRKDFEVTEEELRSRSVVFVGRPETNSALADWQGRLGLNYEQAVFRLSGVDHGSEKEALLLAAAHPADAQRMVLVMAGNSALETVRLASAGLDAYEHSVFEEGKRVVAGFR